MSLWTKYVGYAQAVERRSEWRQMPRRKRLLLALLLLVELSTVLAASGWVLSHTLDPSPHVGTWFACVVAAAVIAPMLVQFAFWPQGALYRMFVYVLPVWAALLLPAALIALHLG